MDTEMQRQRRCDDARLNERGNARNEQLNTCGAYRVANQQSLASLSGSERRRPGWFLDMKYQTCGWNAKLLSTKWKLLSTKLNFGNALSNNGRLNAATQSNKPERQNKRRWEINVHIKVTGGSVWRHFHSQTSWSSS